MGFSHTMAEEVVNAVFNAMSNALINGDRVEIRGFGSFKVKKYDGYTGRNPRTGELTDVINRVDGIFHTFGFFGAFVDQIFLLFGVILEVIKLVLHALGTTDEAPVFVPYD